MRWLRPSVTRALLVSHSLRQRLLTAGALIPAVTLAVLLLPTPGFALAMSVFVLLGAWEWAGLIGLSDRRGRIIYVGGILLLLVLVWFGLGRVWDVWLIGAAVMWWLLLALVLARIREVPPAPPLEPALIPVGVLVLLVPWLALTHLHGSTALGAGPGPVLVLAVLVLTWIADSAAYFVGRRWGRRKLAPNLSPGKTWAGLYGALVGAALWGLVLALLLRLPMGATLGLVLISGLTALASIVGDLYESLLKRRRGLKDAGALLPGHGGMLDRVDSITAAAPVFVFGVLWLQGGV